MNVDEIVEYLRTLPKDAIVKVSVMDKASMARNSIVIDGVVDGGVWCREDIGALIEDNGKNPTPENIDRVLAAVPGGLDDRKNSCPALQRRGPGPGTHRQA